MADGTLSARWDEEYRRGRYVGEQPLAFTADIVAAVRMLGLEQEPGLYIGCGNGRNYVPLCEAGLGLIGLDVSREAIEQLAMRYPAVRDRLVHGDLGDLATDSKYATVIGIQVFQHGSRVETHEHLQSAIERLVPDGLFCIRVNAVGSQVQHQHEVVESDADGGTTIRYLEGPKRGLLVHFFGHDEIAGLLSDLVPVLPLRVDRMYRQDSTRSYWDQWEAISRTAAR